jgi:hypothetical protein
MQLTSTTLLVIGLPLVIYLALIVPTLARLFKGTHPDEISPEWLRSFSPSIYLPMQQLMSGEDFAFLSRQPGFDLSLYRKLRRDRLRIFRKYLRRMIVDFNQLHLAARLAIAQAPEDHSALIPALVLLKLRFSVAVLAAEFRCGMCLFGFKTLSARSLLLSLEKLNAQFQAVSSAA